MVLHKIEKRITGAEQDTKEDQKSSKNNDDQNNQNIDYDSKKFLFEKVEKYQDELLKKYEKIDELIKELGRKDSLIMKLKSDKKIELLSEELEQKEEEIKNLNKKIEKISADLSEKNKKIESLEKIKIHGFDNLKERLKEQNEKVKEQKLFIKSKDETLKDVHKWVDKDKKSPSVENLKNLHADIESLLTKKRKEGKDVSIQTLQIRKLAPDINVAAVFQDQKKVNFLEKRFNELKKEIEDV